MRKEVVRKADRGRQITPDYQPEIQAIQSQSVDEWLKAYGDPNDDWDGPDLFG